MTIANVLMTANMRDHAGVQALARELGVQDSLDPTITPKMDGGRSLLNLRISGAELNDAFHNEAWVGNVEEFCAPPPAPGEDVMKSYPCSTGHTLAYISRYGDVFPCVQFPLPSGNVRRQKFLDIWNHSSELNEVRSIRAKDLTICSSCSHVGTCTRCPGLARMEGNMRGPSTAGCESLFNAPEFNPRICFAAHRLYLSRRWFTLSCEDWVLAVSSQRFQFSAFRQAKPEAHGRAVTLVYIPGREAATKPALRP